MRYKDALWIYGIATTGFIVSAGPVDRWGMWVSFRSMAMGAVSQTTTVSLNGNIILSRTSTGTYTVNSDCTGSLAVTLPPPAGLSQSDFVIVDNGKELRLINTGNGRVLVGNARKQSNHDQSSIVTDVKPLRPPDRMYSDKPIPLRGEVWSHPG